MNRWRRSIGDRTKGLIVSAVTIVLTLLAVEIGLRIVRYGDPYTKDDPFWGFEGTNRAFRAQHVPGQGRLYVPSPNKLDLTPSFPVTKSERTYRIFTFGGSTTHGDPFGLPGSYSTWLQLALAGAYPDRDIEVINTGISGFGSTRVFQIFREAIERYEPDLVIVWNGQNEFRDALFHPWEITRGPVRTAALKILFATRVFRLVHDGYVRMVSLRFGPRHTSRGSQHIATILSRPFSPETFSSYDYFTAPSLVIDSAAPQPEVPARSTWSVRGFAKRLLKASLELGYLTIPPERVYANLRQNSIRMIEIARKSDVPIIFLTPAQNPKARDVMSSPRFRAPGSRNWTAERREAWNAAYASGIENIRNGRCQDALNDFDALSLIVDTSEDHLLQLYKGLCYERLGRHADAVVELERRISRRYHALNAVLREVTSIHGAPLIDVQQTLEEASATGIVGYENYFLDPVHLTIDGYRQVAMAVATTIHQEAYIASDARATVSPSVLADRTRENGTKDWGARVVAAFDSPRVHNAYGWAAFANGDLDEALARANTAVAQDPHEIRAHLLLGYVHTRHGRLDQANRAYETLARLYSP